MQACLVLNLPDDATIVRQVSEFQTLTMKKLQTVTAANELDAANPEEG
jgi:hypothetical protein